MSGERSQERLREVVLVGGGHAHVHVLRGFEMEPPPRSRLTLVVDVPVAVYSGMVPGFVAGQYRAEELEIDVRPLARRCGARVIVAPAVGVDPGRRRIELEGRPAIPYDLASFDIGSTVAGLELPGIREHALPTRPIGLFVRRVAEIVERAREHRAAEPLRAVIVGAGAGGVELAFALEHRLGLESGRRPEVTLLESGPRILPRYPDALLRRVHRRAEGRGIRILRDRRVEGAEAGRVLLEGGESLPFDLMAWVTGAVSQPLFRRSGLPTEERGFVRVRSTLQVEGHDELFAVGDCATLIEHPATPKAGVYAVRQGPVITDNLRAALEGRPLRAYRPQGDFLTLLNLGDGEALGTKWGMAVAGRWVMRLKDRIDRRFMRRFQVLDRGGAPTEAFRGRPEMAGGEMLCGGCASKLGRSELEGALARLGPGREDPTVVLGLGKPDDAAAYRAADGALTVASFDAFRAFTDDPWLVGRVAAVNALSDLWAKGAAPRYAQALVTLPEASAPEEREEILFQVLAGARAAFEPAEVTLLGGHTAVGADLQVGFGVEGSAAGRAALLPLGGLQPGQELILTKPLGTGVLFYADMRALARGPWIEAAVASMLRGNGAAADIAREVGATAVTDVSGFGLAGHLAEMLRASGVAAVLEHRALPALPGALELMARGLRSTFHPENARARRGMVLRPEAAASPRTELLFDPQTSGGLLFGAPEGRGAEAVERLLEGGDRGAARVGRVTEPRADGAPIEVV